MVHALLKGGAMAYRYKVVPFIGQSKAGVSAADVARQLEIAISQEVAQGWDFYLLSDVNIEVQPGCVAGLLGNWKVLLTPFWSVITQTDFQSTASIEKLVRAAAERVKPTAVQPELPLRELKTADGLGFFFWASDRAPKPGEYEHMAQGAVPVGPLLLQFTILSHAAPPMGISAPLAVVTSAQHAD